MNDSRHDARQRRQTRVGKVIWGVLLLGLGTLFLLDNMGVVEADGPSPYPVAQAVDGDPATRWSSAWRDPQWITVDLGEAQPITRVKLHWELAHAREYEIAVSTDGSQWGTVKTVPDGDGGVDEHVVDVIARYVRVTGLKRGDIEGRKRKRYGYSLWELEVFGPGGVLLSRQKPVRASSGKHAHRVTFYWPLTLLAPGLTLLLAPKDGGERVIGLLLGGAGAFLMLRNFKLVSLGFWQAVPLLLILAGVMLVLDAAWQRDSGRPTGGARPAEEAR